MLKKIYNKLFNKITFIDVYKSRKMNKNKKKNILLVGAFPPSSNGAAAYGYWMLKCFEKKDVNVFVLSAGGFIDKKLFPKAGFIRKIEELENIDLIFFILQVLDNKKLMLNINKSAVLFQTYHGYLDDIDIIMQDSDYTKKIIFSTKWAYEFAKTKGYKNIGYLPFGVETSYFDYSDKKINKTKPTILFCSRLCFYKGIIPFLEAIPLIIEKYKYAQIIILGHLDESEKQGVYPYPNNNTVELYNMIKNKLDNILTKYKKNVRCESKWYGQVLDIYKQSDLLVFPSNNEGFGIPIVEAMSCGVIPIVMDKEPMSELVGEDSGYKIRKENWYELEGLMFPTSQSIYNAVEQLIENENYANQRRKNGYKKVQEEYVLSNILDQIIGLNV